MLFYLSPEETIEALKSQAHSLKALTYATYEQSNYHSRYCLTRPVRHVNFDNGGFADFHALEEIHLIRKCPNFENAVLCGRSPPRLRELTIDDYYPLWKSGCRKASENPSTEDLIKATPFLRVHSPSTPKNLTTMTVNYVYNSAGPVGLRESEGKTISETAAAIKGQVWVDIICGIQASLPILSTVSSRRAPTTRRVVV